MGGPERDRVALKVGFELRPPSLTTIVGSSEPRIEPTEQLPVLGPQTGFRHTATRRRRFRSSFSKILSRHWSLSVASIGLDLSCNTLGLSPKSLRGSPWQVGLMVPGLCTAEPA